METLVCVKPQIDGLAQDCSNSSALQSCTKPLRFVCVLSDYSNVFNLFCAKATHLPNRMIAEIKYINTLWPSDTIWRQRSGSTLAQVMACCLTAPSHYLDQSWLIICEVQWHSYQFNFTRDASTINHWNPFVNYISKISYKFPRGQWVKTRTDITVIYPASIISCANLVMHLDIQGICWYDTLCVRNIPE